jgi:tetratricopeptide (TPR) repeat protein
MDTKQAFLQAVEAAKQKDFAKSREILRTIIKTEPKNIDALLLYARVAQKREHAIKCLERVLEINPKHQYAQQLLTKISSNHPQKQSIETPIENKSARQLDTSTSSRPDLEKIPATAKESNSSTSIAQSPLSETAKKADREVKILWAIGIITVCCFISVFGVVLFQNQAPFSLGLASEPTPTANELYASIYSNIRAANSENLTAYMNTIHSKSPLYNQTERLLKEAFSEFDLSYYVSDLEIEKQSRSEAEIHFRLTTRKLRGPAFRDNVVEGIFIMRPEDGVWKIYDQEVIDVQYIN